MISWWGWGAPPVPCWSQFMGSPETPGGRVGSPRPPTLPAAMFVGSCAGGQTPEMGLVTCGPGPGQPPAWLSRGRLPFFKHKLPGGLGPGRWPLPLCLLAAVLCIVLILLSNVLNLLNTPGMRRLCPQRPAAGVGTCTPWGPRTGQLCAMVVGGPTLRVEVAVITLFPLRPQKPSELPCKRDPYRPLVRVAHGWLSWLLAYCFEKCIFLKNKIYVY